MMFGDNHRMRIITNQAEAEKEKKMGPWPPAGQGRPRIPSQVRIW